jgi:hypothetical protein
VPVKRDSAGGIKEGNGYPRRWLTTDVYINRSLPTGLKRKFAGVFAENAFGGETSLSGRGSDLDQTKKIQEELPKLLRKLRVTSLTDIPCGDQNWISKVDLSGIDYLGADIVRALIENNNEKFSTMHRAYIELDITRQVPPRSDLILCRDLLVHLSTKEITKALRNIKRSTSAYLLTTTFTSNREYKDLPVITRSVGWRPINLEARPFNFPKPLDVINEGCTEGDGSFADKSLGLWRISDLVL